MDDPKSCRVLLVDDEEPILRTLGTYLKLRGYTVDTFASPRDALEWLRSNDAHIVLTDLVMEGMDGIEFIRALRDAGCLAQIVVITAFSTVDRAVESYLLGVSDYVLKPFENLDEIGVVVDQAAERILRWRRVMALALAEEVPS